MSSDPTRCRWLLYALVAVAFAIVSLYRLSTAVLADRLAAAFAASGTEQGTLHAAFFVVYAAMQLPRASSPTGRGPAWPSRAEPR